MKKLGRDADDDKMAEVTKKENGKIIHVDDQGNEVELVEKDFKPPPPEKKDGNDEGSDSENFKSGFANINNEDTKDSLKKCLDLSLNSKIITFLRFQLFVSIATSFAEIFSYKLYLLSK